MNTQTRFTLSTVLGLALVGLCLGSAQAQSGKKMKMQHKMADGKMMNDNMMPGSMMGDDMMMMEPAPVDYPFAAPGGIHLFHYTDYSHEAMEEGSASMKKMDNMEMHHKMMHDRMMHDGMMDGDMMMEPAPVDYPFAAPGGIHLFHYTDYSHEAMEEGSASMKKMDNMEMHHKMMHDKMMHDKMMSSSMMEDDDMMMAEPTPVGYPFAAPGGLHLYHYTDYSQEGVGEGSASMKKMEKMDKMMKPGKMMK